MTEIRKEVIKMVQNPIVELFELDLTGVSGIDEIIRFTSSSRDGEPLQFGSHTYAPLPIEVTGFEWNSRGTSPRPKMQLIAADLTFLNMIVEFDGFIGKTLTRIKTFEKYLVGGTNPNPSAHFPIEVYVINQKSAQTKMSVEFVLSSPLDLESMKLPRQIVAKDYCPLRYRMPNKAGTEFDYTGVNCPWTSEEHYYNVKGEEVMDFSKDACGKTLADCKLRFGVEAVLPFLGFPGINRY
jgi:lambda family phage minor tail protein L